MQNFANACSEAGNPMVHLYYAEASFIDLLSYAFIFIGLFGRSKRLFLYVVLQVAAKNLIKWTRIIPLSGSFRCWVTLVLDKLLACRQSEKMLSRLSAGALKKAVSLKAAGLAASRSSTLLNSSSV